MEVGVESWFYYLSKKYKNIVVYYKNGNLEQIKRLAKNVEVRKFNGELIKCKNFFCCYNPDILEYVDAKTIFHVVHCDYKQTFFKPIMHPKVDKYIGVSKLVCDSFTELTGKECELIYNPVVIEKPNVEKESGLYLISATRLSNEKGRKRIIQLAKMLERKHINYEWHIYTNKIRPFNIGNIILEEPKLDIIPEIAKASYLVQLSDHEAFCYSVVESLMVGTPVIVTDLPVFKELGVKHGENAIVCDLDMSNVDLHKIENGLPPFKYEPPKDNWDKYLDNNTDYTPDKKFKVKVRKNYTDINLGHQDKGAILEMPALRVAELENKGYVERI